MTSKTNLTHHDRPKRYDAATTVLRQDLRSFGNKTISYTNTKFSTLCRKRLRKQKFCASRVKQARICEIDEVVAARTRSKRHDARVAHSSRSRPKIRKFVLSRVSRKRRVDLNSAKLRDDSTPKLSLFFVDNSTKTFDGFENELRDAGASSLQICVASTRAETPTAYFDAHRSEVLECGEMVNDTSGKLESSEISTANTMPPSNTNAIYGRTIGVYVLAWLFVCFISSFDTFLFCGFYL